MAMLDYLGKIVALPDGTKIGTVQDIERQPITSRFFAIIALNPPWKGKTIKVPIGELRKIADNAFALSTRFGDGLKKELYGEPEPVEIKPAPKTSPTVTFKPHTPKLPTPPPQPKAPPPPSQAPTPTKIASKDAEVWASISKQISGKKEETTTAPPRPTSHTPPSVSAPPPSAQLPKELKCPKCKKKVQSTFKFCPHCRFPLFCISCGNPILDRKWKSCPQCGFVFK